MPPQRDIDRLIDKYRLQRQARAGEPLTLDDDARNHLMNVVEEQYGSAGFVSSQEAAEKFAQSLAWQKGLSRWWHKMVPWVGFAGVCCLALIVIFVAANHEKGPQQALVTGPDLMESVESAKTPPPAGPTSATEPTDSAKAQRIMKDDSTAGAMAPVVASAPAPMKAKTAPEPMPKRASPAIVINAPLPDPSAPMAEEPNNTRQTISPTASFAKLSGAPSRDLDADTTPASELKPVSEPRSPAKEPAPKTAQKKSVLVASSPRPAAPPVQSIAPISEPIEFNTAPSMADADAGTASSGRSAKAAQTAFQSAPPTPVPPPTPIAWTAPSKNSGATPAVSASRARAVAINAPASTPRMQKFRQATVGGGRSNLSSQTRQTVMGEFDLLVNGSRVTIKDADGSIYKGNVIAVQAERFGFRVSGLNRTTGKRIDFDGGYTPAVSSTGRGSNTATIVEGQLKIAGRQPSRLTARRAR